MYQLGIIVIGYNGN